MASRIGCLVLSLSISSVAGAAAPTPPVVAEAKEPARFLWELSDVIWNFLPLQERIERAAPLLVEECRADEGCVVPRWFEDLRSKFEEEKVSSGPAAARACAARVCSVSLEAWAASGKPADLVRPSEWQLAAQSWCPLAFASGSNALCAAVHVPPGDATNIVLHELALLYCARAEERPPRACELYSEQGPDGMIMAAKTSALPLVAGLLGRAARLDGTPQAAAQLESAFSRWGRPMFGVPSPRPKRPIAEIRKVLAQASRVPASKPKLWQSLVELAKALDATGKRKEAAEAWDRLAASLAEASTDEAREASDRARSYVELGVAMKHAKRSEAAGVAQEEAARWAQRYVQAKAVEIEKIELLPCDGDGCLDLAEQILSPGKSFSWVEPARRRQRACLILEGSCAQFPATCERARRRLEELKAKSES